MIRLQTEKACSLELEMTAVLASPNVWSPRPVVVFELDATHFPFDLRRESDDMLVAMGQRPVGRLESQGPDAVAEWLARAAIILQRASGADVQFHQWRRSSCAARHTIAVECDEPQLARLACETLCRWLTSLAQGESLNWSAEWEQVDDRAYEICLGEITGPIVAAARARGITCLRLDEESLVQLGQGCRQRRIWRATTSRTGMIANWLATRKPLAKQLLADMGIPVPHGCQVSTAGEACRAAESLGWPVVVKPADADFGNGVSIRLLNPEEVHEAFDRARQWSDRVLVEKFVDGNLHRFLVVDGQLVGAVRREPAYVVGDGQHTILELAIAANYDPVRGSDYQSPLAAGRRVKCLARNEWPNDFVPPRGRAVQLIGDVHMRHGGIQVDRTAEVHPEIKRLVVDAAEIIGLDIAGLDVLAEDVTRSPWEQSFAVLEINSEPAIVLHMAPFCVPPRPVAEAIVESLFPRGETGRIPLIAALRDGVGDAFARQLATRRQRTGQSVGFVNRQGAWLDGRLLGGSQDHVRKHLERVWRHPRTETVIVELTLADILREGVPFNCCDRLFETRPTAAGWRDGEVRFTPEEQCALRCLRATVQRNHCC